MTQTLKKDLIRLKKLSIANLVISILIGFFCFIGFMIMLANQIIGWTAFALVFGLLGAFIGIHIYLVFKSLWIFATNKDKQLSKMFLSTVLAMCFIPGFGCIYNIVAYNHLTNEYLNNTSESKLGQEK
ncbi:hypothetical protein U5U50_01310 [Mycoplasma sp. 888]|uniref:hypothetical protein n=1 Tax=Mycoplasma sp. 888 TaxID=3108483 RepID=UPI002D79C530|nr:hypothetical protein [Mycoplasma sp. 888]WRQ26020.1 hypothetical protein U5U50_01310 [Mycoplasma sp. 888]